MEEAQRVRLDVRSTMQQSPEFARGSGMRTPRIASQALAEAREWLMGQIPQILSTSEGIS